MKQQANLIRAGQVIEHEGRRWTVLKQQIITPGKGGAFIQVEMRDLKSGNKTNERWRTADTVERLMTEEKEYTYSYTEGDNMVLMDPETFEQAHVPTGLLGDAAPFLQDNMNITIDLVEGEPVAAHLPPTVMLEVVEADPVVKGQTAVLLLQAGSPLQRRENLRAALHRNPASASSSVPRTPATSSGPRAEPRLAVPPLPHLTVMANAAQKASKRLLRDFNEVEQLQVSVKGPSDFVSQADLRAEATLQGGAQPRPAPATPSSWRKAALRLRQLVLALGGRSAGRHHQLPARHAALGDQHRPGEAAAGRRLRNRRRTDLRPGGGRDVLGRKGRRRLHERTPAARLGAARIQGGGVRHRHPLRRGLARRGGRRSPARSQR